MTDVLKGGSEECVCVGKKPRIGIGEKTRDGRSSLTISWVSSLCDLRRPCGWGRVSPKRFPRIGKDSSAGERMCVLARRKTGEDLSNES